MPSPTPLPIGPVPQSERIEVLDILRGWAVFGIFLADVDITFHIATGTDRVLEQLHEFFVVNKFWPLFAFLFGLGFALQMLRAEARGAGFVTFYRRRLFVLLLIGLANALLLVQVWRGDILHRYAILGFLLLLFRRCSPRNLLIAASFCLLINPAQKAVERAMHDYRLADPQTAPQVIAEDARRTARERVEDEEKHRILRQGTYWLLMATRAKYFARHEWRRYLLFFFPPFLLGLYVGRRRVFEDLPAHLLFVRRIMWWGLGLGVAGNLVFVATAKASNLAWPNVTHLAAGILKAFGDPALSFSYASVAILLVQSEKWRIRLAPLAAPGRMALTNYLFQAVVLAVICPNYGLGLYDRLSLPAAWCLAVVVFVIQMLLSVWWMRRFRFGPAEWLWRTLTYGKLQPMRVQLVVAV